jgi:hypothetical protein
MLFAWFSPKGMVIENVLSIPPLAFAGNRAPFRSASSADVMAGRSGKNFSTGELRRDTIDPARRVVHQEVSAREATNGRE